MERQPTPRPRRALTTLAVMALAGLSACTPAPEGAPPTTTPVAPTTSTTSGSGTVEVAPCASGTQPYAAEGSIGATGRAATDARLLAEIGWSVYPSCERVTFTFASEEGAPAVVPPPSTASLDRGPGIVRVRLPDAVSGAVIATQRVESRLVEDIYVVRERDGTLSVDLHLAAPAEARLLGGSGPSTLWVDLVSGGSPFRSAPVRSGDVVLMSPTGGAAGYPLTVTGYSRAAGPVEVRLTGGDEQAATQVDPAGDGPEWGAFDALFVDGPTGPTTLTAGPVGVVVEIGP